MIWPRTTGFHKWTPRTYAQLTRMSFNDVYNEISSHFEEYYTSLSASGNIVSWGYIWSNWTPYDWGGKTLDDSTWVITTSIENLVINQWTSVQKEESSTTQTLSTLTALQAMTLEQMTTELNSNAEFYYDYFAAQGWLSRASWREVEYDYVMHDPNTGDMYYLFRCWLGGCRWDWTPYGPDFWF